MKLLRRLTLVACVLFAFPVSAQLNTDFLGVQTELMAEPAFPEPGEEVTVSFANYGSRYYNAEVVWRVNDVVVADANNKREVTYVAGQLGEGDVVTATVVRSSGSSQVFGMQVVPTYVDIVIEPQTRVPDFYQGRALPSIGSQINVTALINKGDVIDPSQHIYTWIMNGKVLEGGPIRGGNQVSFDTPQGSRVTMSVEVIDLQGNVVGRRAIYFQSVKPELEFYEINTLHGQSHLAIDNSYILSGSAATLMAEPYYLDIRTYNNPDINEWEIDGTEQANDNPNPYRITVQKVEDGGRSELSFHVRSTTQLLQGVRGNINILY